MESLAHSQAGRLESLKPTLLSIHQAQLIIDKSISMASSTRVRDECAECFDSGSSASGPLSLALALTEPLIQPYGKAIVWLE